MNNQYTNEASSNPIYPITDLFPPIRGTPRAGWDACDNEILETEHMISLWPPMDVLALTGATALSFKSFVQADTSDLSTVECECQYPGCNWSVIPQRSSIWASDADVVCGLRARYSDPAQQSALTFAGPV